MEKIMVVDEKVKRKMAILCFTPAVAFFISLVYYIILLLPLTKGHPVPASAVGITSLHYTTLFIMLATSATISAGVLLYCIVYMVRIKSINTPIKMIWMLLLLIVPVSFILFWYFIVKNEPRNEPVYPSIN